MSHGGHRPPKRASLIGPLMLYLAHARRHPPREPSGLWVCVAGAAFFSFIVFMLLRRETTSDALILALILFGYLLFTMISTMPDDKK